MIKMHLLSLTEVVITHCVCMYEKKRERESTRLCFKHVKAFTISLMEVMRMKRKNKVEYIIHLSEEDE